VYHVLSFFVVQSSHLELCLSLLQGPRTTFIKLHLRFLFNPIHSLTPFQAPNDHQRRPPSQGHEVIFQSRCPVQPSKKTFHPPRNQTPRRSGQDHSDHSHPLHFTQRLEKFPTMDSPDIKLDLIDAMSSDHNDLDVDDSVQSTPSPNPNQASETTPATSSSSQAPTSAPRRPPRKSTLTQQQKNQKRQRATQDQLVTLEMEFSKNATPTAATRERIAQEINMTERSVQIWFQNRCADFTGTN
jgi:hypothetical protein